MEEAFVKRRNSLTSVVITAYLSQSTPLALTTNASNTAIGASLEQEIGGIWMPIRFFSHKLGTIESNYSTSTVYHKDRPQALHIGFLPERG